MQRLSLDPAKSLRYIWQGQQAINGWWQFIFIDHVNSQIKKVEY